MSKSTPDVLVIGSAGHLGCALMLCLSLHGHTPLGIDILPSKTTTIVGTITDIDFVSQIFRDNPSIRHVIHTATLHKPHVDSHSKQDFVDTNITGTLILLEEASKHRERIESFVFTSTTSTFGSALSPQPGSPAIWIDENVVPMPKNIYGVTKVAAEDMCYLIHKQTGMPVLVLRTSRFFPEEDDDEHRRTSMSDENLKICELAYRRVDIADVVQSCVCAMKKAREIGWGKYIISSPTPFLREPEMLRRLDLVPGEVMAELLPAAGEAFENRGWKFLDRVDRVYDSSRAVKELGWKPVHTFEEAVERLSRGEEWRSQMTLHVGKRGYHAVATGVYTVR